MVDSNAEKANLFIKYLSEIFTWDYDITQDPENLEKFNQFINSPVQMELPTKYTLTNEFLFLIKMLKYGIFPGYDLIINKILRNFLHKHIILITYSKLVTLK